MTDAERRLWWHLRELKTKGAHFRRQATIGPYFADFACHECKLVIEVDGSGHAEREKIAADNVRTRFLESQGYRVLRFWNNDVLKDTEAVMMVIYDALNALQPQQPPTPDPSPPRAKSARGEGNA